MKNKVFLASCLSLVFAQSAFSQQTAEVVRTELSKIKTISVATGHNSQSGKNMVKELFSGARVKLDDLDVALDYSAGKDANYGLDSNVIVSQEETLSLYAFFDDGEIAESSDNFESACELKINVVPGEIADKTALEEQYYTEVFANNPNADVDAVTKQFEESLTNKSVSRLFDALYSALKSGLSVKSVTTNNGTLVNTVNILAEKEEIISNLIPGSSLVSNEKIKIKGEMTCSSLASRLSVGNTKLISDEKLNNWIGQDNWFAQNIYRVKQMDQSAIQYNVGDFLILGK